uniref:Uncharacterized protein n=1 Tax=Rangifer tarandus platyrhynchus TaxID=3082113 RepID=A0ACB0DYC6_RANTA|nr:unnamed protein product [Rangifer tarandus platyrhynchus]
MLGGALRGALVSAAKRDDVCDPCPDLPSLRYGGIYRLTRRADVRRRHSGIGEAPATGTDREHPGACLPPDQSTRVGAASPGVRSRAGRQRLGQGGPTAPGRDPPPCQAPTRPDPGTCARRRLPESRRGTSPHPDPEPASLPASPAVPRFRPGARRSGRTGKADPGISRRRGKGGIFLCRSRSAPSFVSPPPSIFCPAEGWLRGLREAACPGHRDGGRVRGALRAPSGSRAGGAASLPPARRPGLQRPNNGHIVLAAHRPSLASGGRPDPARGGSGRKPAAQIQIGRPWRRAGDRSAREPALTWGRRFSLPTAAGPPSLVPVALHPLLREGDSFDFT